MLHILRLRDALDFRLNPCDLNNCDHMTFFFIFRQVNIEFKIILCID
jgi:hypothetical protein